MLVKVYTSPHITMVGFIQEILQNAGIECLLKNYFLTSGIGDLPANEAWPELWVSQAQAAVALQLIQQTLKEPASQTSWTCAHCGEMLEGQFDRCWQCGTARV